MSLARWTTAIKSQKWVWDDTVSLGQLQHLWKLLQDIVPSKNATMYGTSLIFNNQTNDTLGSDGYDNYQAPQEAGKQLFERRMWVSGSLKFLENPRVGDHLRCVEKVSSVRKVGDSVFVTVQRNTRKLELSEGYEGGAISKEKVGGTVVDEVRSLVYKWRDEATEAESPGEPSVSDSTSPFDTSLFTHTINLSISAAHVARFSALSYNLHKIHLDKSYCLSEGYEDVVVSGPLLVNVMLHSFASVYSKTTLGSFRYRMSSPCYVNRRLKLTMEKKPECFDISLWDNGRKICHGTAVPE